MWTFLFQTISVSLVALLLLLIKWIFADKLSPRWQYGIWTLLALRILIPVSMSTNIFLPIPLWMETWKTNVELGLNSAYSSPYIPILTGFSFLSESFSNFLSGITPQSVTDWIFVIYLVGIALCLLWYVISYYRLRRLLHFGKPAPQTQMEQIRSVCKIYHLKPCKAITVSGLHSAFICGVIRPVLVLPDDKDIDDMVILHELLHLKYHDAFQNVFWCVLRAVHWCNPFLHYIFNCIGNDMESLCDQRVLELLRGEQRREYGKILLSMANEPYARTVGTTSLSNGGKNISKRITAIVRFKKFPKGMALVSICIAILVGETVLAGTTVTYDNNDYFPSSPSDILESFSISRLNRCTTIAGALDTYAKGLMYGNVIYLATASPLSDQQDLFNASIKPKITYAPSENYFIYNEETGFVRIESNILPENDSIYDSESSILLNPNRGYSIYNLTEVAEDTYEALLCFGTLDYGDDMYEYANGILAVPVVVLKDKLSPNVYSTDTWVVERKEDYSLFCVEEEQVDYYFIEQELPCVEQFEIAGKTGNFTLSVRTTHSLSSYNLFTSSNVSTSFSGIGVNTYEPYINYFDEVPKTNEIFEYSYEQLHFVYECTQTDQAPTESVVVQIEPVFSLEKLSTLKKQLPEVELKGYESVSSSDGWEAIKISETWDKTITVDNNIHIGSHDTSNDFRRNYCWLVKVLWDGELVEMFTIGEERLK